MFDPTPIIVAVITQLPSSVLAFLAWRSSMRNHGLINSKMGELISAKEAVSKAAGVVEGRAEQKGEDNVRPKT